MRELIGDSWPELWRHSYGRAERRERERGFMEAAAPVWMICRRCIGRNKFLLDSLLPPQPLWHLGGAVISPLIVPIIAIGPSAAASGPRALPLRASPHIVDDHMPTHDIRRADIEHRRTRSSGSRPNE
jgi:hypothetical protein